MKYAVIPLALLLWFLHGLDVIFYTTQDARLFDINLYLSVITIIITMLLILSDKK
jgi:uncharacterized membrane protein